MNLFSLLQYKVYDYKTLYDNSNVIKSIKKTDYDINVVIGVYKRKEYLNSSLMYMKKAILKSDLKIAITVVEISDSAENKNLIDEDINYIYIPIDLIKTENQYSRALGFNIGYYFTPKSNYYLFHDCDILVPEEFFNTIHKNYLNDNFQWMQTFTKKRLRLLNPDISEYIRKDNYVCLDDLREYDYKVAKEGAAGGSTLVKRDIFELVGGFDPEVFYGYAPEDSFFMVKLCCLKRELYLITDSHQADPENYADNPSIELCHIHHEPMENKNPKFEYMRGLYEGFLTFLYYQKMQYINMKRNIMNIQNKKLMI